MKKALLYKIVAKLGPSQISAMKVLGENSFGSYFHKENYHIDVCQGPTCASAMCLWKKSFGFVPKEPH